MTGYRYANAKSLQHVKEQNHVSACDFSMVYSVKGLWTGS